MQYEIQFLLECMMIDSNLLSIDCTYIFDDIGWVVAGGMGAMHSIEF